MVTITELTWEDDQLLELFMLLDQREQGLLMRHAAVSACYAAACRENERDACGVALTDTPEAVAIKALWRCAPTLPYGCSSNTDFESLVERAVKNRLADRALDMILTTSEHDGRNAQVLVNWANEFAHRFGSDYCVPDIEEGYVDRSDMQRFIGEWRDSFMINLRRSYTRLSRAQEPQPKP